MLAYINSISKYKIDFSLIKQTDMFDKEIFKHEASFYHAEAYKSNELKREETFLTKTYDFLTLTWLKLWRI